MAGREDISALLQRIAATDDKAAFVEFFRRYHAKLIQFSLMFLPSYQDAEDVVSEVMIKLLRQRKKLTQIANFEGYLYLSVKNQSLNHLKKTNKFQRQPIDLHDDHFTSSYIQPLEFILEKELRDLVTQTVEKLPPQRQLIYKLIKDDGLKCKEVSELLNIADKTVKKHLELAIRDLRQAVEDFYREKGDSAPVIRMTGNLCAFVLATISLLI